MVRRHDASRDRSKETVGDPGDVAPIDRLRSAITELRRLAQEPLFEALGHLADVSKILDDPDVTGGDIRRLRPLSPEYLRVATELEAAARCCLLIERELRPEVPSLGVGAQAQSEAAGTSEPNRSAGNKRHMGLAGWSRTISRRKRPLANEGRRIQVAVTQPPTAPSATSFRPRGRPNTDVAAHVLGPLELYISGRRVVRWGSLKARAVFQYLLLHHDRPVRREVLMNLQWPDHTRTSARNNLNVALHSLRNTLNGPWHELQPILYQYGCYVLNPALRWWMDRDEFLAAFSKADMVRVSGRPGEAICHYRKAVQLYRGPLFEDDLSDDWYLPEQRHLSELYLDALESLGKIYFDLGDLPSAERFGQLALATDPCRESVHRLLMRCFASEYKQHLVSRQYRLCVDALRTELGVSPHGETFRLFRDLTSTSP